MFDKTIVADLPTKIKDAPMGEIIKAISEQTATQSLTHLHLAHLKLNAQSNADALGKLLSQQAPKLTSIYLEQMFGKKKL